MSSPAAPLDFLQAIKLTFAAEKQTADRAIAQLENEQLHASLDPRMNCIAVIMKHVAGNLISRWTDFLTSDGEKPSRDRDDEFIDTLTTREELLARWEEGWSRLFAALDALTAADCQAMVSIRGEPMSVPAALCRSLAHTAYHMGQIVQSARALAGDRWTTLTIPPGGSNEFNRRTWGPASPSIATDQ